MKKVRRTKMDGCAICGSPIGKVAGLPICKNGHRLTISMDYSAPRNERKIAFGHVQKIDPDAPVPDPRETSKHPKGPRSNRLTFK